MDCAKVRERATAKGEKGREDDDADRGRTKTGVGEGFCLVAITIQSRRNVCGTKWSVMGKRLQQLHIGGERKQQGRQRPSRRERVVEEQC